MKKNWIYKTACLFSLSVACLISSCSKTENGQDGLETDGAVVFHTRSSETNPQQSPLFEEGSVVGFYMVSTSLSETEELTGKRTFDNTKFIMEAGGKFTSTPISYYPKDHSLFHDIYAYAPYREQALQAGSSKLDLRVAADQSSGSNYTGSDFLFAKSLDFRTAQGTIDLEFVHLFSRVKIVLKPGSGYADVGSIEAPRNVVLQGVNTEAELDFGTARLSGIQTPADITPYGLFRETTTSLEGVSAIIIPQTIAAGTAFMDIRAGEDHFIFKPITDLVFEPGTESTITLTLNATFDGIVITMDVSIEPWIGDEQIDLDGDEITPPVGNTVTDVEGNSYPIVRIGRQYWMGTNLKSTKYNDGTPIPNITDPIQWQTTTEGAYCVYDNEAANLQKYGGLYNRAAVETRKLCPDGWHLPSAYDWNLLGETLGGIEDEYNTWQGVGSALKSTQGWPAGTNGTNSSKFDALPNGYIYSTTDYEPHAKFQNGGDKAYWWSFSSMSALMPFVRSLSYSDDDLNRFAASVMSGYGVRCVHDF